jgi:dihydroxyacid dehydratase/phosphogluconate dehydratase
MGSAGMSFSLPSRDIIADSIETVSKRKKKSSGNISRRKGIIKNGF